MRYSLQYNEDEPSFNTGFERLTSRFAKILYFMCGNFHCLQSRTMLKSLELCPRTKTLKNKEIL